MLVGGIEGVMNFLLLVCQLQVPNRVFGKGRFSCGGGASQCDI